MLIRKRWKEVYILFALLMVSLDFSRLGDNFPSHFFHIDHSFHINKFVAVAREGITSYAEQGNLPVRVFIPPALIPFLFLAFVLPPKFAYFLSYFLMLLISYWVTKKISPGNEKYMLLAILFPLSIQSFMTTGRLLEFMAHLAFLILLFYIDKGKNKLITTTLFMIGTTSHLPTMVFYGPLLFFKSISKKIAKHFWYWGSFTLLWIALYIPPTLGKLGWITPRSEILYDMAKAVLLNQGFGWIFTSLVLVAMGILMSIFMLGKEGLYSLPSVFIAVVFPMAYIFGLPFNLNIPGWNQIIITTLVPPFSYLLLRRSQKVWKQLTLITSILLIVPMPWVGTISENFQYLDQLDGNYTTTLFPPEAASDMFFTQNYLAYRGLPTPKSPTFEYSEPEWFFYSPKSCNELNVGLKHIILPKSEVWVKNCDNVIETPDLFIAHIN
ncbi:MAG: hypothetical protein GOU98_00385 [Candidatus Altiarchaeota archaeon]|nr:hypothetical protein [Candidatus Altiarchaeota archaeon]